MKPDTTLKVLAYIFSAVGLVTGAVAAWFIFAHLQFAASAVRAEGVVIEDHGTPRVGFEVAGRTVEIHGRFSSSPPSYTAGEKVTVIYPPERPEEGRIDSFGQAYLGALISGGLGLVFGGIGGGILLVQIRAARRRERALALGTRVQAKVTSIFLRTSVRVNGRSPWVIEATFNEGSGAMSKSYLFTSDSIWIDPEPFYPVGSDVTVCYLEEEPGVNAFVLDKLPEAV